MKIGVNFYKPFLENMQKFDILDPKLNIFQSHFLEASAGTGKTFTIENLIVRLLLESDQPVTLQEILAVTFTREAAREMKNRIRKKLEAFSNHPRVRQALIDYDEMQVYTIHGFCHRMLNKYAFEARAPFEITSFDQLDHLKEMKETVKDFFRTGSKEFAYEATVLLKRTGFDFDKLMGWIFETMQKEEKPIVLKLPEIPPITKNALERDFFLLAPNYKRFDPEKYKQQLDQFYRFLQTKKKEDLLQEKDWFFEKMEEGNKKVHAKELTSNFFEFLQKEIVPYLKVARDPKQILMRVACECWNRWKTKETKKDCFTFDTLLKKMDFSLQNPSFLEKVQTSYKAVIIDEFQDTDPLQWKIFKKLFLKKHLLYLVGDPKQSIYGFRNADIYTYMQAAQALGKEKKVYLDTNFRSSPSLVDALNQLFMKRPDWIQLPSQPNALQYHPVKAGRKEKEFSISPIHYFGVKTELKKEKNWPTHQMEEKQLFPYIAKEIVQLHQKHQIPFSEMVILVKDRFQGQRMQKHLRRWNLSSTMRKTVTLTESRGFFAMKILLQATLYPENDSLVRSALFGPFMKGKENPFFELKKIFQEEGFSSFFSYFISKYFCGHKDPSLYLEMRQTAEILVQIPFSKIEILLHEMEELKKLDPEFDKRIKLQNEDGKEKIPIMTTFASKGLEFTVVFALGMASRHFLSEMNEEKQAEKMRQLYVAFTRSKEKLYIPILSDLSNKPYSQESASPIELFFIDESLPVEWIDEIPIQPYKEEKEEIHLTAPSKISLNFEKEYVTSFSAMTKFTSPLFLKERFAMQDLNRKTPHTIPLGSETGTLIHKVFESHFLNRKTAIEQIVCEVFNGTHLEGWEEIIAELVKDILELFLRDGFCLNFLKEGEYFQEMEFLIPRNHQLVKGFADLVFQKDNNFYLVDWKTNWLGPADEDYQLENLHHAMASHEYYMQAEIYFEAMKRYVKQFYINPQFGGAYYIFVRGKKAVHLGLS